MIQGPAPIFLFNQRPMGSRTGWKQECGDALHEVISKDVFEMASSLTHGASSSGKTQGFGPCIRRFESSRPSHRLIDRTGSHPLGFWIACNLNLNKDEP